MKRSLLIGLLLAVLAASLGLWVYNDRTRRGEGVEDAALFIPRETAVTPEIRRLQEYVRIDTSNPPGREMAGAQYLAAMLNRNGIDAEIIEAAPGRASVYARIRGRRPNEGLLLLSHIDVVPADPKGWSHPPFAATIAFNMMYGRGALDMKSITMCEVEAFLDVARSGRTPERDIVFLATSDEEQGGALGIRWLLEQRPDVIAGVKYALNEGGITETRKERISYFGIETGTKMTVKVRLRAPSREHMQRVRIALEPYISPRDPDRVLPEVREFLHDIAPHRIEHRALLDDVLRTIAAGKFWLLPRGYRELMQNIVWARNVAVDAKGAATMNVTMYNLPDENPDARLAWLRGVIAPFGATVDEVSEKSGPTPISSRHTPLFALLTREIHRSYGDVPIGTEILVAWYNDSRYLRVKGITCYGLWPFPVDFYQTQGIHAADERLRVDWFMDGVGMMRRVVAAYAFEP
jgi:acetylornithine deacetylase/succinyl-diaminopimelate desuccinylase-like protein